MDCVVAATVALAVGTFKFYALFLFNLIATSQLPHFTPTSASPQTLAPTRTALHHGRTFFKWHVTHRQLVSGKAEASMLARQQYSRSLTRTSFARWVRQHGITRFIAKDTLQWLF